MILHSVFWCIEYILSYIFTPALLWCYHVSNVFISTDLPFTTVTGSFRLPIVYPRKFSAIFSNKLHTRQELAIVYSSRSDSYKFSTPVLSINFFEIVSKPNFPLDSINYSPTALYVTHSQARANVPSIRSTNSHKSEICRFESHTRTGINFGAYTSFFSARGIANQRGAKMRQARDASPWLSRGGVGDGIARDCIDNFERMESEVLYPSDRWTKTASFSLMLNVFGHPIFFGGKSFTGIDEREIVSKAIWRVARK